MFLKLSKKIFAIGIILIGIIATIDFFYIGISKRVIAKVETLLTDPNKVAICKSHIQPITLSNAQKDSEFYKLLRSSKSVTFIGDSITGGGKNGGCGWYERQSKT